MAIHEVKGDAITAVMECGHDILLHICNNKGKMGSGIAWSIKQRCYPAYKAYMGNFNNGIGGLGSTSYYETPNYCIFNMVAQDGYGPAGSGICYLSYDALMQCLQQVKTFADRYNEKPSIVIPYLMGSYRAGGKWPVVKAMVGSVLEDYEVYIYKQDVK